MKNSSLGLPVTPGLPGLTGVVNKLPTRSPSRHQQSHEPVEPDQMKTQFVSLNVELIDSSPYQPRIIFDQVELERLAASISTETQSTPIIVRPTQNGRYELIGGERRLRASKLLGKAVVDAVIRDISDDQAAFMVVIDNDGRSDLSDYERGRSYKQLMDKFGIETQLELSNRINVSTSTLTRCLAYFKLPQPVIDMLNSKPDLLGNKVSAEFASLSKKGFEELVVRHVKTILDGACSQEVALANAKHEALPKKLPTIRDLNNSGKRVASVRYQGNRNVVISCEKGVDPSKLIAKLEELLASSDIDLSQPSKKSNS